MVLMGIMLILSDRVAVWRGGDRGWIPDSDPNRSHHGAEEPFEELDGRIVLPQLPAPPGYGTFGSILGSMWYPSDATWVFNFRELQRIGIKDERALVEIKTVAPSSSRQSDDRTMPERLNQAMAILDAQSNGKMKFGWVAERGRIIYISSVDDLEAEKRWRQQRLDKAGAELRRALDREIPHAWFPKMTTAEAIYECGRLSGVTIDDRVARTNPPRLLEFNANYLTFERLIELILRKTEGQPSPLRFKADGKRLIVFEEKEGP